MKNCLICNNKKLNKAIKPNTKIFLSSDFKKFLFSPKYLICESCGTISKEISIKFKKIINKIYKNYKSFDFFNEIDQIKYGFSSNNSNISKHRCEILVDYLYKYLNKKNKKINFLDYGAGNGAMMYNFGKKFAKANLNALDVNKKKYSKIRKIKNFNKFFNLNEFKKTKEKFDIVTLIHVLEHSLNPLNDLKLIKSKLNESGILIIQVPNIKMNPFDLIVMDHTYHFNKESLVALLTKGGYKILKLNSNLIKSEITIICKKTKKNPVLKKISKKNYLSIIEYHQRNTKYLNNYIDLVKKKHFDYLAIFGTSIAGSWLAYNLNQGDFIFVDDNPNRQNINYITTKVYETRKIISKNKYDIILPLPYIKIKFIKAKHPYERYIYPKY